MPINTDALKKYVTQVCNVFLLAGVFTLSACSTEEPAELSGAQSTVTPATAAAITLSTDSEFINGELFAIEKALNFNDPARVALLDKVRGSVGVVGSGSRTIWSRKNAAGLGLYVSANHVHGISSWANLDAEYIDISLQENGRFNNAHLIADNGDVNLFTEITSDFPLYHPSITSNISNSDILPKDDFYIGVIDNQKRTNDGLDRLYKPEVIQLHTPLALYDPQARTTSQITWNSAIADQDVMIVGYPQNRTTYPFGATSIGKVLSTATANELIAKLAENGDQEGDIAYNAEAEFIVNAKSVVGMSGGGVFNTNGELLGIVVRGAALNGQSMVRVVRMSYIQNNIETFFRTLYQDEKNFLKQFFGDEINSISNAMQISM